MNSEEQKNEYWRAAKSLKRYIKNYNIEIKVDKNDIFNKLNEFKNDFSPEKINSLSADELFNILPFIAGSRDNLCYALETKYNENFGSIRGGAVYKFGLYKNNEGKWRSGSAARQKEIRKDEAFKICLERRNKIIQVTDLIKEFSFNTLENYKEVDKRLNTILDETKYKDKLYASAWLHKYLSMIYPDYFANYHSETWQRHILYGLGIMPGATRYIRSGQISMVARLADMSIYEFSDVLYKIFGHKPVKFIRIGCSDNDNIYDKDWKQNSIIAVGWKELGPLTNFVKNDKINKDALADKLEKLYYNGNRSAATRKAGEIKLFYDNSANPETPENAIFVVIHGERLIGFADTIGEYYYDNNTPMAHARSCNWKNVFTETEKLPISSEGKLTTCYEFNKPENMIYLYQKYYGLLADEVIDVEDVKSKLDKNIILYGPPGTGKTYNSARYAVAICDNLPLDEVCKWNYADVMKRYNELKIADRINFVTFHQSYGYEEFIEGISPVLDDDNVSYIIKDGAFKQFCWQISRNNTVVTDFESAWQNLISIMKSEEFNSQYTFTRQSGTTFECSLVDDETFEMTYSTGRVTRLKKNRIKELYNNPEIYNNKDKCASGTKYLLEIKQAIVNELKNISQSSNDETKYNNNYVFIIDEINRGNISKIFGELITLIEPSKRDGMEEAVSVKLPYSGEAFSVPNNVYIIGTMNTADRSIAMMDTALRRRFSFVEMLPDTDVIKKKNIIVDGLDIAEMLKVMNNRITYLYDREHTLGHAFFMPLNDNPTKEALKYIFKNKIIPLLQEYFYEDYNKIRLVLGDNGKLEKYQFIKEEKQEVNNLFKGKVSDLIDDYSNKYIINDDAFDDIESYKQIL